MEEVKRLFNLFNNFEYEYLECMLNEMVREGWILEKCNFLMKFRRSTKHYGRYTIISKPTMYVEEEEKSIWKSAGWDYIDEYQGLEIYYTEDIHAEEPFTEPEDIRIQKKKFVKTSVFNAIVSLLLAAMIIYENVSVPWAEPRILHQINVYGPIGYLISAGMGVLMILSFIYSLVVMIRIIKRSNEYGAVTSDECRRRRKKNNARFVLCILALAVILGSAGVNSVKEHKDNDNQGNAVHPVCVSEID